MPPLFTPQFLGLPPKFENYFPGQEEAIGSIINSQARFDILPASTGFGKSATYYSIASFYAMFGYRTLILTANRGLQDQNVRDFSPVGLVDIRGMRNYDCIAMSKPGGEFFPFYLEYILERGYFPGCDEGPCLAGYRCPHKLYPLEKGPCDYFGQVAKAGIAKIKQSNYAYWIRAGGAGQGKDKDNKLGRVDILILDEAHEAAAQLSNALTLRIGWWDLKKIGQQIPSQSADYDWQTWARKIEKLAQARVENLKARGRPLSYARDVRQLSDLEDKAARLQKKQADWIFNYDPRHVLHWEPLWPAPYAESHLYRGAKKVIFTSATVREKHLELCGVPKDQTLWHRAPNAFSPGRRPVIFADVYPRIRIKWPYPTDTLDMLFSRVDRIIEDRLFRKGIVHSVNYKLGQRLYAMSKYRDLMIVPERDSKDATARAVAQYKASPAPRILVSPAVYQGYDFPDDECRYQIVLKLAFPDTNDAISSARSERDPEYKHFMAMTHLVQAVGRGMRNVGDWCETIILDAQVLWFMSQYRHLAPDWFHAAYRVSQGFPPKLNPRAA